MVPHSHPPSGLSPFHPLYLLLSEDSCQHLTWALPSSHSHPHLWSLSSWTLMNKPSARSWAFPLISNPCIILCAYEHLPCLHTSPRHLRSWENTVDEVGGGLQVKRGRVWFTKTHSPKVCDKDSKRSQCMVLEFQWTLDFIFFKSGFLSCVLCTKNKQTKTPF